MSQSRGKRKRGNAMGGVTPAPSRGQARPSPAPAARHDPAWRVARRRRVEAPGARQPPRDVQLGQGVREPGPWGCHEHGLDRQRFSRRRATAERIYPRKSGLNTGFATHQGRAMPRRDDAPARGSGLNTGLERHQVRHQVRRSASLPRRCRVESGSILAPTAARDLPELSGPGFRIATWWPPLESQSSSGEASSSMNDA
jgi:hypothetical protein